MSDTQDFQERGEPWRAALGINGTAGDAQDVAHEFIPDSPGGPCLACGLAKSYRKHQRLMSADYTDKAALYPGT